MMIELSLGPEFQQTLAELQAAGRDLVPAVSKGLAEGVKFAAGKVISEYMSSQSLKRRSGNLARAVEGWLEKPLEGIVGVRENAAVSKYKWLLGDEQMTITPKKGRALTIPIGEALTGAGIAKYDSVKNAEDVLGTKIFRLKGRNVLGYKVGKKGKFRPLFVLVKSVFVQGSGALIDGVLDSVDAMSAAIEKRIDAVTGAA